MEISQKPSNWIEDLPPGANTSVASFSAEPADGALTIATGSNQIDREFEQSVSLPWQSGLQSIRGWVMQMAAASYSVLNRLDPAAGFVEGVIRRVPELYFLSGQGTSLLMACLLLLQPLVLMAGLLSVASAWLTARVLQMHHRFAGTSSYVYNPLLVGLGLGTSLAWNPAMVLLIALAGSLTFFVTVLLTRILFEQQGLPVLSLPFAFVTIACQLIQPHYAALRPVNTLLHDQLASSGLIAFGIAFFRSLGAILYLPNAWIGACIGLLILAKSRILFVLAVGGFAVGVATRSTLTGQSAYDPSNDAVAFNFALTSMAIGGVFLVPSLASYGLAMVSVAVSVLCCDLLLRLGAVGHFLPYTLPFNIAVICVLYVGASSLRPFRPRFIGDTPEETLAMNLANRWRFQPLETSIRLPFYGAWTVWQGFDGEWTHQGLWRYAYDFVITDDQQQTHSGLGNQLTDYYAYGKPVVSPIRGQIVLLQQDRPDQLIGQTDRDHPWGNFVVIRDHRGFYVEISHLLQGSLKVALYEDVEIGTVIGLCGNSGYSPQPHIHIQLQHSIDPASETMPFTFRNYIEAGTIHSHGLPEEKSVVESGVVSPVLDAATSFSLDDRLVYHILYRGTPAGKLELNVRMAVDGTFYFQSNRGKLYFGKQDGQFWLLRHDGSDEHLRRWLEAFPRIPLTACEGRRWSDNLPSGWIARGWEAWLGSMLSTAIPEFARSTIAAQFENAHVMNSQSTIPFSNRKGKSHVFFDGQKGFAVITNGPWQYERVEYRHG